MRARPFDGKRAIVAGGTRGLGSTIAWTFAERGASVRVCGRTEEDVQAFDRRSRDGGLDARAAVADVRDRPELQAWLQRQVPDGSLDIFVANAGTAASDGDWRETFEAMVLYVIESCEILEAPLRAASGTVVILSSTAASYTGMGSATAAYGSAKAALDHFAGHLAQEWGPRGVRVNIVAPGPVEVPGGYWAPGAEGDPALASTLRNRAALGRFVTAQEVADAVAYLASPQAAGVTGATLRVDAGLLKTPGR